MRALPILPALLLVPLVAAVGPTDAYAGVDPIARFDAWQDPYNPASSMSCLAPMTLQVQRNAGGGWDVLARGVTTAPSPFGALDDAATVPSSAQNCPTLLIPTLSYPNMAGSPSTGFSKVYSDACYYEGTYVSPFTLGGPASLSYYRAYARSCYGTGYSFAISVSPLAMG